MQLIYSAQNEMDAHFFKGLLEQQGIQAVVEGEALEQVWGTLPISKTSLPSVWVSDEDAERARPIVEEYNRRHVLNNEGGERAVPSTWVCPGCGEAVEEQFTECWKCGTTRPLGSAGEG